MNNIRILSPKSDFLFKKLFFDENDKNEILRKLLQDCIEFDNKQVSEIMLIDRTIDRELEDDKTVVFDVNARLTDETLVNVEIQKSNQLGFAKRTIFYASKRLSIQGARGLGYKNLKQTVSLNIVDFDLFIDTNEFYSTFYLIEINRHTKLNDLLRIDFLELRKSILEEDNSKKALWVRFFNAKSKEELDMIKNTDESFTEVTEKLVNLSSDPSVLTAYEEREKIRLDEIGRIQYAEQHGHELGLEEGIGLSIRKMINKGYSKETIIDVLDINEDVYKKFS